MATSLNRVTLIGYLGRDPETKEVPTGQMVALSVATSETWTDRDGQRREWTDWHQVGIYNDTLGTLAMDRLSKGSRVYLEGKLQTRRWTDEDGMDRSMTTVVIPKYDGQLIIL